MSETKTSDTERDYEVGRGKPPVHRRFKKRQSGNPRVPRPKSLPALLVDALNETVVATIDGERREITKRGAVVTQLVNKSTCADLRPTKMLIDMLKDAEKKAGAAAPPRARSVCRGGRGSDGNLHHKAAILGGGTPAARYGERRVIARTMTVADKFTWSTYDTLLRLDFVSFAQRCFREPSPRTQVVMNWHIEIAAKLMALHAGQIRRLIINMPPRHLKSLLASVAFPAWCLGHDPAAPCRMRAFSN